MYEQRQDEQQKKVGVREFRENLSNYIEGTETVAITKHGETVGFYIPTKPSPTQQELEALETATAKMQVLMEKMNVSEDELVKEFKELRRADRAKQKNDE